MKIMNWQQKLEMKSTNVLPNNIKKHDKKIKFNYTILF